MPRETLSTNAPLSAAGSAAQRALFDEDHSGAFIGSMEADGADPGFRSGFHLINGGAPVLEPVVKSNNHPVAVNASYLDGEGAAEDWNDNWPKGVSYAPMVRREARMDDGGSKATFLAVADKGEDESKSQSTSLKIGPNTTRDNLDFKSGATRSKPRRSGLKKLNSKQLSLDWPPAPRGCEWRRSANGLNLWRCWTDWDDDKTKKIKKSRYAGHLSDDAWRIMKEYDHEAFISIVGEQLRRHSGR
jgi:hypothetical protein